MNEKLFQSQKINLNENGVNPNVKALITIKPKVVIITLTKILEKLEVENLTDTVEQEEEKNLQKVVQVAKVHGVTIQKLFLKTLKIIMMNIILKKL